MPTTNRFLYYRLISAGFKKGDRLVADVSEATVALREAAHLDPLNLRMNEIVDRTRGVSDFEGWSSVLACAKAYTRGAELDRWFADSTPMLMVESNSLAGVLEPLAREYRTYLVPLGGQSSCGLLGGEVAPKLSHYQHILYLGDFDFSGGHIENSARERLEAYADVSLNWQKIALTEEQVEKHGLERIKRFDKRTQTTHDAVETEALNQRILVPLVREALEALEPEDVTEEEEEQRADVLARLSSPERGVA